MLSPRRSFDKWIEVKTGYSRPWTIKEKITTGKFRSTLLDWLWPPEWGEGSLPLSCQ
jgi:two-component system, chemotaxis family, sensor kinase Cph1